MTFKILLSGLSSLNIVINKIISGSYVFNLRFELHVVYFEEPLLFVLYECC